MNGRTPTIALAGNPNVGKSTVFNELTGMKQHTGNWAGKTVELAEGEVKYGDNTYRLVDLPGTYSLLTHSAEEEVARDFICYGEADAVIVICDATCLERNLNLALQIMEITENVVVCVNLIDEARKKGITVDHEKLEKLLGVPVVAACARDAEGIGELLKRTVGVIDGAEKPLALIPPYPQPIGYGVSLVGAALPPVLGVPRRWAAVRLLCGAELDLGISEREQQTVMAAAQEARQRTARDNLLSIEDEVASHLVRSAERIASQVVTHEKEDYNERDRKLDRILTSRTFGVPIMLLLLMGIFWLTITGMNYPSELLFKLTFWLGGKFRELFEAVNAPWWLTGAIVDGMYSTLAWVVSVMLPPMSIFFPLFTLLEDFGYLPRAAFTLDNSFKKAGACGKQALTTCMGFGCNAVGVSECRIIDSPRERLVATVTNAFVPCNGRFPMIITLISIFLAGSSRFSSLAGAGILTIVIVFGVIMTFLASWLMSKTLLKGEASSFTLELPPYRRPQIGKVIVRSVIDRVLHVLSRAAAVAAPAGLVIWLLANINVGGMSLINLAANALDPLGTLMGMNGVILLAFILGWPANELVLPVTLMLLMSETALIPMRSVSEVGALLISGGFTGITAVCMIVFSLLHWPCSTTCLTIKSETKSLKWTLVSIALPTILGIVICILISKISMVLMV